MANRRSSLTRVGILTACALLSVFGCTEEDGGLGPGTVVDVGNTVDEFRWQFTATAGVTRTLTYTWTTTGPVADVIQGGGILTGAATIVIRDAGGTEIYSRSVAEAGTFQTASGTVGDWTVVFTLTDATAITSVRLEIP